MPKHHETLMNFLISICGVFLNSCALNPPAIPSPPPANINQYNCNTYVNGDNNTWNESLPEGK